METTFITIHDLSAEARILFSSDSIIDILGYSPEEVLNQSCWNFFHPDELPLAKATHGRGVDSDKAAVLSYCRMRDKEGHWLGCEVVFTVVYDVMVGCTSIYRRGLKSQNRALEAPAIRRFFSSSPRDPRYHMLAHLSAKFSLTPKPQIHEPRAALFLNRYTRTLTIMYATEGLADVLGMSGEELRGRSFYYCIQENCLQDAVRCLENAKANDSIAYLRFWFRDPRQDDQIRNWQSSYTDLEDDVMEDVRSSDDDNDGGGVNLRSHMEGGTQRNRNHSASPPDSQPLSSSASVEPPDLTTRMQHEVHTDSRASSGHNSTNIYSHEAVFGDIEHPSSSASSLEESPDGEHRQFHDLSFTHQPIRDIELEAVVSCTSDGLVVCLRRARPIAANLAAQLTPPGYTHGLFATPWATQPILPPPQLLHQYSSSSSLPPEVSSSNSLHRSPQLQAPAPQQNFMTAIQECAVFAWALTGINGSLAQYGYGSPRGEAQPASGLPIWQNEPPSHSLVPLGTNAVPSYNYSPENGNSYNSGNNGRASLARDPFGDPGLRKGNKPDAGSPPFGFAGAASSVNGVRVVAQSQRNW